MAAPRCWRLWARPPLMMGRGLQQRTACHEPVLCPDSCRDRNSDSPVHYTVTKGKRTRTMSLEKKVNKALEDFSLEKRRLQEPKLLPS